MGVSYKKLFKLLIDRDLKKKDLQEMTGLSSASITKMAKNENVNMEVVVKVCEALQVDVGDTMEIERSEGVYGLCLLMSCKRIQMRIYRRKPI